MLGLSSQLRSFLLVPKMRNSNGKPPSMKPFNPVEHGLSEDFVLTNFTKMKG